MEQLLTFTGNVEIEYNDREYIIIADEYKTRSNSYEDAINQMVGLFENEKTLKLEIQEMKTELEKYGTLVFKITDQICMESYPEQYSTEATLGIEGCQIVVKGSIDSWDEKALYNQLLCSLYDLIDIIKQTIEK